MGSWRPTRSSRFTSTATYLAIALNRDSWIAMGKRSRTASTTTRTSTERLTPASRSRLAIQMSDRPKPWEVSTEPVTRIVIRPQFVGPRAREEGEAERIIDVSAIPAQDSGFQFNVLGYTAPHLRCTQLRNER